MSRHTSPNKTSSIGEDIPPSRKSFSSSDDITVGTPKQRRKKRTEAQQLQTDTIEALHLDSDILTSGSRVLRPQRTLLDSQEEQAIR